MSATPWLKFYPTDWRSDPRLRVCSMAARGLWIEMLSLMHDATPYGHLLVSGRSPTDAQLAVLVGAPSDQVSELLGELEAAGVFSRTREGVIYSRKMTRMQKKAATARNNGRRGGNPKLGNQRDNSTLDNPMDKGEDKPQKLEARGHITVSKDTDADGVVDLTQVLWSRGVSFLVRHGVKEKSARTMIGKWLKGHSVSEVFQAFGAASKNGTRDPVPYITKALRGNGEQKLDAWGIADAKPVRFEQSPEHQDAEGDAGEADLPSMLAPSQEVEPENPMSVGDAELGGDCGFLSSLRLVGGRSV